MDRDSDAIESSADFRPGELLVEATARRRRVRRQTLALNAAGGLVSVAMLLAPPPLSYMGAFLLCIVVFVSSFEEFCRRRLINEITAINMNLGCRDAAI